MTTFSSAASVMKMGAHCLVRSSMSTAAASREVSKRTEEVLCSSREERKSEGKATTGALAWAWTACCWGCSLRL